MVLRLIESASVLHLFGLFMEMFQVFFRFREANSHVLLSCIQQTKQIAVQWLTFLFLKLLPTDKQQEVDIPSLKIDHSDQIPHPHAQVQGKSKILHADPPFQNTCSTFHVECLHTG